MGRRNMTRHGEGIGHDWLTPRGGDERINTRRQFPEGDGSGYASDKIWTNLSTGLGQPEIIPENPAIAEQGTLPNQVLALISQQGPRVFGRDDRVGGIDADCAEPSRFDSFDTAGYALGMNHSSATEAGTQCQKQQAESPGTCFHEATTGL
jgi:hypothetical protein